MKKFKFTKLTIIIAILTMLLTACAGSNNEAEKPDSNEQVNEESNEEANETNEESTVKITDLHGEVTVPVNPKKVVALDSRSYETLSDWGIELAAAPKSVMPEDSTYVKDESVENIGDHREPNLEIIAAADPDLVIVGQRFASHYEEIKKLVPNAAVIDLNFDVSEEAETPGENLVNGLKKTTVDLGKIFDKNKEAEKLVAEFDESIEEAKSAYNGTDKMMSLVVSGGDIGFTAPLHGRVWVPMYEIFDWKPSLEVDSSSSDHKGDDISVEAIAQSNPDWILVLDRDAAVSSVDDKVPAQDVIDNSPALKNTKAITEEKIIYAPNDTYSNESIQTYIELFKSLSSALTK